MQTSGRILRYAISHVLAVLGEDLPAELRDLVQLGDHFPRSLGQLPFVSVSAETTAEQPKGLGRTVGLKRVPIDGAPVDLGYIAGGAGECALALTLWAVTYQQLQDLLSGIEGIAWEPREHSWEEPAGVLLNRTSLRRARWDSVLAASPVAPPPAPPHITVTGANPSVRTGPANSFASLGQVSRDDEFELIGRNSSGAWIQGRSLEGQLLWIRSTRASTSLPLAIVPVTGEEAPDLGLGVSSIEATAAATVWSQSLELVATLQVTHEPITSAGELIEELRITRQLGDDGQIVEVERTRLLVDDEEMVDEFPD